MKTKNIHLSPVVQIFKNEQGVAHQQVDGLYFAGQYRRLSFSSRKTKRTNLRAVNASGGRSRCSPCRILQEKMQLHTDSTLKIGCRME